MELPDGLPTTPTGPPCRRCTHPTERTILPDRHIDSCSDCLIIEVTLT